MTNTTQATRLSEEVARMMAEGADASTIAEGAVRVLREETQGSGAATCPVCDQLAAERSMSVGQIHVEALAIAYHELEGDLEMFFHAPSMVWGRTSRPVTDTAKLCAFGLLEPLELTRCSEPSTLGGMYRVTELGERFLHGNASIPKSLRVYNGEVLSASPKTVTVDDIWGRKFDLYADIVRAAPAKRGIMAGA